MNKTATNYIYNLSYQIMLVIVPIITIPYLSRVLGADGIGLYSYSNSITMYFSLIGNLGINLYGQRQIAYEKDDIKRRTACFYELVILRISASLISIFTYILFCMFVVNESELQELLLVQLIVIASSLIDISWFFQGLEDFKVTATRSMLVKIITVILIFTFIKNQDDLLLYTIIISGSTFLGNLVLLTKVKKNIVKIHKADLNVKRHIKPVFKLFLPQIASSVHTILDKSMIGYLSINSEVAFYQQTQKIINVLLSISTALNTVLMPKISNLKANNSTAEIKRFMAISIRYILLITCPLTIGTIVIAEDFVPVFFGAEFQPAVIVMQVMAVLMIIIGLSNTIGVQYLVPMGRQDEFTRSILLGTAFNVILNYFLIIKIGALGATISTVIAEIIITLYQYYRARNDLKSINIISMLAKYLLLSIGMGIPTYWIGTFGIPVIPRIIAQVLSGVIVYLILLIITKDKFVNYILNWRNKYEV